MVRALTMGAALAVLCGCAKLLASNVAPLSVPFPPRSVVAAHAGDYRAFVATWMGSMPVRSFEAPFPMSPNDNRLVAVSDSGKTMDRQRNVLLTTFSEWCRDSKGSVWPRSDAMTAPGNNMVVCETPPPVVTRLAAMRITANLDAAREGRHELYVEHWSAPDIPRYLRERQETLAREAVAQREAAAKLHAQEVATREARRSKDRLLLDQMATNASRMRTTPACLRFERESNALLARFSVALNRADLQRYTSDMAVALGECVSAKALPAESLLVVYRFNLQSFQLLGDVWDRQLMPWCLPHVVCDVQDKEFSDTKQREIGELQARYSELRGLLPPERPAHITERAHRFVLDR